MKFRTGVAVGFAVGYYFGAKAGRERYYQLRTQLQELGNAEPVAKSIAAVQLVVERVRSRPQVDEFLTDLDAYERRQGA
jgi:hypothetical protein